MPIEIIILFLLESYTVIQRWLQQKLLDCVIRKQKPRLTGIHRTEMVELGVFVPYPEEGREAKDQRRPSVLHSKDKHKKRKNDTLCLRK